MFMKINVDTALINMIKFVWVWTGADGVVRKMGSEHSSLYAADLSLLSQIFPESFPDGCADFRGDMLVIKWVHVITRARAILAVCVTRLLPPGLSPSPLGFWMT